MKKLDNEAITALRSLYERLDILYDWRDDLSLAELIKKAEWHIEAQELQRYNDAFEEEERREMNEL